MMLTCTYRIALTDATAHSLDWDSEKKKLKKRNSINNENHVRRHNGKNCRKEKKSYKSVLNQLYKNNTKEKWAAHDREEEDDWELYIEEWSTIKCALFYLNKIK